jgi:serine/threonine protein kinase
MAPPTTTPKEAARDPIGQVAVRPFGKYFLVRKLAEGGMAEIFLAKQVGVEGFEKNVVIKRMLQHLSSVTDFVNMFLDEARLATRLAHPNIVQINDLGNADGCYYICMEYLAGEDFSTLLRTSARRREYVPLNVSLKVLAEAATGLHYAHEFTDTKGNPMNVVHRDISPSNIFVSYTGQVKVLDFGIARAESRVTNTTAGIVKGKYQYMSPEQARSDKVDRRADIYSLGVSLYEAVTNVRPFARDNDLAILNAVLNSDFKRPREARPDLPEEVERIILKALAPISERYQTAQAFAQDLEVYLQAHTSAAGGMGMAAFMTAFFGPDRVASKTRIDSLSELATKGVDVPGFKNPLAPKTDPSGDAGHFLEGATKAVGLPKSIVKQHSRRRGIAAIGLALLVAVGAGVAIGMIKVQPPVVDPNSVVDAGVVGGPNLPIANEIVDAGAPAVVDAGGGELVIRPPPVKLGPLTPPIIMKGVRQHAGPVSRCFDTYKDDLPSDTGQLSVFFTILGSGKVSQAKSQLSEKRVGQCIEQAVMAMRFPLNTDKEVSLTLPFAYQVKR